MEDFSLRNKINPNTNHFIVDNTKVSDLIVSIKQRDTNTLTNILANHVIKKIKAIPVTITNLRDGIAWKFMSN